MYELSVKGHFDAAHALVGYPGECRNLHGHTWDVEVTVAANELDDIDIVYDFKSLKADLARVLEPYDHVFINEVAPFDALSPTAENLARVLYESLERNITQATSARVHLKEVTVWESPVARLTYRPE
ncbi:MAG: 6-carboxytetrahydropterin synthase QueD [Coriobacteriales bacterium]|nr:6-carboxytetrahydropterin synthase QueD [Actinomycetes bacterium]